MLPIRCALNTNKCSIRFYPLVCNYLSRRYNSNEKSILPSSKSAGNDLNTTVRPMGEKVKETAKTTSYLGVILIGIGVTGALFYTVFCELFSSKSPNNVYSKAAKKCINDTRIEDKLGYPITAFGEETRRRRRQHVSHAFYTDKAGKEHLRMKFHLQGSAHRGTAHLDMVENDAGSYEYRYLFVEVEDLARTVIVLEDNRNKSLAEGSATSPNFGASFSF